jgi:uncharacterized membrane protein
MIHPALAHFAVVLPIVALVFALIYLLKRDERMSKVTTFALAFAMVAMGLAWFSGSQAGPDVYPLLSDEGQKTLLEHKGYGLYLFVAMVVAAVIMFFGYQKKKFLAELAATVVLLLASGVTLYQGSLGGKLVYEYGAGVENYSDGMDCLEEMYGEE